MKQSKRFLAIILAVVLVLGMTTPGFAAYGGIENGELRVENEDQLLNLGCDNGTYSEDAATEPPAPPSDLPTMDVQTTSPAALAPAYIGIMPTQITTPLHLTAGAANSASGPGWNWNGSTLALSGIDLAVTNGPAIQLPANSTITLATGTTNTIANTQTGGGNTAFGIQALGYLSISGDGVLNINSNGNGISTVLAGISIENSTIVIVSNNFAGINASAAVTLTNTHITISAGTVGIAGHPSPITITGGNINITSGTHGIHPGPLGINIENGANVTIDAGGNGIDANTGSITIQSGAGVTIDAGGFGIHSQSGNVNISDNNTVVNAPDGINTPNGNLIINGNPTVISAHTITTAAITGVQTPTTGQTRIRTGATATGNFSVSLITWSPTGGTTFIGGRQYTASVTLTANAGHTFPTGFTATINGEAATVNITNPGTEGNAVTVARQFAETNLIPINAAVNVTPPATGDVPSGASTGPGNFTRGTVTWTPGNNPFTDGTQYTASITLTAEPGHTFPATFTATLNGNTATVENLSPGTDANQVTLSWEFAPTHTIPGAPQGFTATAGDTEVVLSWTAPLNDGGSPITGYEVSSDNGATWVAADSNTGHTFTGLTNGDTYTFRVRAVNNVGNGAEASATATPIAVIDIKDKQGVTVPVLGATPVTAITPTAQFTGTVTWAHSGGTAGATFGAQRVYTATITLTPETGFTLQGVAANSFTVAGATSVSNPANSGVITAVFPATSAQGGNWGGGGAWPPATGTTTPPTTAIPPEDVPLADYDEPEDLPQFPFIDVFETDWFYPYVRTVWEDQLFQGTSYNMFTPQGSMTRAMFVQVLYRIENGELRVENENYDSNNAQFTWYYDAFQWAIDQGLVEGVGNGDFQPNIAITREEMAVILHNYVVSRSITLPQGASRIFTDHSTISARALEGVLAIQAAGIILGHADGRFAPQDTATRAEVAAIFARFWEIADLPVAVPDGEDFAEDGEAG